MNANAFRQFYAYHFDENRKLWDSITTLSDEQFNRDDAYSHGSVKNQVVHLISADDEWFSALRGIIGLPSLESANFPDRKAIRAHWDSVEQSMRDYLAALRDETLFERPFADVEGDDSKLIVWQVLLHVVNHGTDHRAVLLRLLNELGVATTSQDYIFYVFDHMK